MKESGVQEIIGLLRIDRIGAIEQQHRSIRERYEAPYSARNYEDFKDRIVGYYSYHMRECLGAQPTSQESWSWHAMGAVKELLDKKYDGGFDKAEQNAIKGREGGLIGVINAIAQAIEERAIEEYIKAVFAEHIQPSDYQRQLRLAEEYVRVFAQHLLPGEQLEPTWIIAGGIERAIKTHVGIMNNLRKTIT